jgi:hypothetical protein
MGTRPGGKKNRTLLYLRILSNRAFLQGKAPGAKSLVGKTVVELGKRPGSWLTCKDLEDGKFE